MKYYNFKTNYEWLGVIRIKSYDLKQARKKGKKLIHKRVSTLAGKKISLKLIAIGGH